MTDVPLITKNISVVYTENLTRVIVKPYHTSGSEQDEGLKTTYNTDFRICLLNVTNKMVSLHLSRNYVKIVSRVLTVCAACFLCFVCNK